ncbi:hypothetical protein DERP_015298 [Dermatophagoides pteronyssinus]|uniref:AraC family transcriptional regulator n=1 Tax=Dermatophagoides pteronyssinus TaxID=6956 RepID=A0ABQ8JU99_DERPT|nr:hypothetical protein DERP_015298 [Dermatophagoides pteronyssinus]
MVKLLLEHDISILLKQSIFPDFTDPILYYTIDSGSIKLVKLEFKFIIMKKGELQISFNDN